MLRNFFLPLFKDWAWIAVNMVIGVGLIYVGLCSELSLFATDMTLLPLNSITTCVAISGLVSITVGILWLKLYKKPK